MTVTKDQAQMLTSLAIACRPNGARRWDSAGTMAAIGKVADRDLASVVIAVVRVASDRDVDSPGIIPTAGSHWSEAAAVRTRPLNVAPPGTRCTICDKPEALHTRSEQVDHTFRRMQAKAAPEVIHGAVNALKAAIEPAPPRSDAPPPPDRCETGDCTRGWGHGGEHQGPPEVGEVAAG